MEAVSYYYRVYVAAVAAAAQQNTENNLLERVKSLSNITFMEYAKAKFEADDKPDKFEEYAWAHCACLDVEVGGTVARYGFNYSQPDSIAVNDDTPYILQHFKRSYDPPTSIEELQTKVCLGARCPEVVIMDWF